MRGNELRIKASHGGITGAQLQALATRLETEFGCVAVGAPIYRTFGTPPNNGFAAVALYRQFIITLLSTGTTITVQMLAKGSHDMFALETAIVQGLGLQNAALFRQEIDA